MAQIATNTPTPAAWPDTRHDQHMTPGWWIIPMALLGTLMWGGLFAWLI